jgi:hypothetical protein
MFIEKLKILTCFTDFYLIIRAIFIVVEKDKELLIFFEKINNFFLSSIDFFFLSFWFNMRKSWSRDVDL